MRVALVSYNARSGDAIGNLVAEKLTFFHEHGADVRVFIEDDQNLHPVVRPFCRRVADTQPRGSEWEYASRADLVSFEYGLAYQLLDWLPLLARAQRRILFDYHGITPPALWRGPQRETLERGQQLRGLAWCAEKAIVHSRFAVRELCEPTRFPAERTTVLPHFVDRARFYPGPPRRDLRDALGTGAAHLMLFVGRVAPNKGVPALIELAGLLRDVKPAVHLVVAGDDSDVYQAEAEFCRRRAFELGIYERVHFLGHVSDEELVDAYRSATVLVMPSRHEGFCIPALEAFACGVPVLAARAGALNETVGDAGLTFAVDDVKGMERLVRRVLEAKEPALPTKEPLRVAVVSFRYGTDIVGGAEGSLRVMAKTLHAAGHDVQVFTTCTRDESNWSNQLPEGMTEIDGLAVHRFSIDPHDRASHVETVRRILESDRPVDDQLAQEYLRHSIHSSRLIAALRERMPELDAVLVGPYLFGVTADVAQAFPEKTVLVPCFHAEPFAQLPIWHECYQQVGGILYHSLEEQDLAQIELGLNHPAGRYQGTLIDTSEAGSEGVVSRRLIDQRYLVYCGRYSRQKNLPLLLDHMERYQAAHPGRFMLVCIGRGEVALPAAGWIRDLGFVEEARKREILAGADALVQLSELESLSLVALEAWAAGTPVIANASCPPLAGLVKRSRGGKCVADYQAFTSALDDLWEQPERWREMGHQGRAYVCRHFGDAQAFLGRLEETIRDLTVPLAEKMRRRGLERAARHDRECWREHFGVIVERLLDEPASTYRLHLEVRPRVKTRKAAAGSGTVLLPVQLCNRGTHPVVAEGPARMLLRSRIVGDDQVDSRFVETPLPGIVNPGQDVPAAVRLPVPDHPGIYEVELAIVEAESFADLKPVLNLAEPARVELIVERNSEPVQAGCLAELLTTVQSSLAGAHQRQRLPDSYVDVTQGFFARGKRWIKQKLLGNFKHAYVDVLSRQQSAFNREVVTALGELAEACSLLDHSHAKDGKPTPEDLKGQLTEIARRQARIEERLARLEESLRSAGVADVPQER
jgi:glycosyltransferase involved in cell wall biosynthesis